MIFEKKRILIYRWNAYNYMDVIQTFSDMGFEIETLERELASYDEDVDFQKMLEQLLRSDRFDFVFTINYFGVISDACEQVGLPYVSWSCDSPLISMFHESVYNECNYIFLFDKSSCLFFKELGLKHIWHLPLAVDSSRIAHILREAEDLKLYQNDISFIGSLYERNSYDRLAPTLPEYLKGYFDCALEAQMNISGGNLLELLMTDEICTQLQQYYQLKKSERSFSDLKLIFATTVLGYKVAKEQRISYLLELGKKMQVSIYTNSDTSKLIGVDYRGSVDYWTQMPKVFNGSKINLNITIPNIKSGIPLRVWDVLGSGGFLMTNYQPELESYFKLDKDLVVFEGKRELAQKAAYYLEHEEERREIARHGYETVKMLHSYHTRMDTLFDILAESTQ